MKSLLAPGERLDDLGNGMRIIQCREKFAFSTDAVALASFVSLLKGDRVMDLGTGTGAVALLMKGRCPLSRVTGLELQAGLVDMATRTMVHNELADSVEVVQGDIRCIREIFSPESYDVVVSNPPYLPVSGQLSNRKEAFALARHELTCTLEDVVAAFSWLVRFGGKVALVHRPQRLVDVFVLLRSRNLEPKRLQMVYPRPGAAPALFLVEAQKGARPGLKTLKPMMLGGAGD